MTTVTPDSLPKKEKPNFGRAVENGKIRFLSVSQIVTFDANQEGGCQRRWWFQKIGGKKEPATAAQDAGKEYAASLQHYEETGEDILVPVLRAAKHLFPRPGSDLECEREMYDPARKPLLAANNIPIIGAADIRHKRGEYVDFDGLVRKEDPGMRVVEIIDLKTTSRISDYTNSKGKFFKGYAKTAEQILAHPQVVGYGVHASNLYPDTTHVRLGHVYAQTKSGYAATKRHGLLTVEEARGRWSTVEVIAREMEDVARNAKRPEDVLYNLKACVSYNKECPHAPYCDRPTAGVATLFQLRATRTPSPISVPKGEPMSGLFASLSTSTAPVTNGAAGPTIIAPPVPPPAPTGGLFGSMAPSAPTPPAIPTPPQSAGERETAIANERARLEAEDALSAAPAGRHPLEGLEGYAVGQLCNGRGYYASSTGQAFIVVERGHACTSCAKPVFDPANIAAVNPPDAPGVDPLAAADALAPEVIAGIADPEIKAKAEAHAFAHAQKKEAEAQAKGAGAGSKSSGRCDAGGKTYALTRDQAGKKKMKCPSCAKEVKIKPSDDFESTVMPAHNMPKTEEKTTPHVIAATPKSGDSPLPPLPATQPPPIPMLPMASPPALMFVIPDVKDVKSCSRCDQLERENIALRNTVHTLTAVK